MPDILTGGGDWLKLEEEGWVSPQVAAVDKAFYELAIKERDYERARVDRLTAELADLRQRHAA